VVKDYSQQLMTVWVLLGCSLQKQSKDIIIQQKNNINILLKNIKKAPLNLSGAFYKELKN
jgi:hypothetical protein